MAFVLGRVGAPGVQVLVALDEVGAVGAQQVDEQRRDIPAQVQPDAADPVAPAAAAASSNGSTCAGASLIPGMSGAMSTPYGIRPVELGDRLQPRPRVRRVRLGGPPGRRVERGIERFAWMSVTAAISFMSSTSRSSSGDFVRIEQGCARRASPPRCRA